MLKLLHWIIFLRKIKHIPHIKSAEILDHTGGNHKILDLRQRSDSNDKGDFRDLYKLNFSLNEK